MSSLLARARLMQPESMQLIRQIIHNAEDPTAEAAAKYEAHADAPCSPNYLRATCQDTLVRLGTLLDWHAEYMTTPLLLLMQYSRLSVATCKAKLKEAWKICYSSAARGSCGAQESSSSLGQFT